MKAIFSDTLSSDDRAAIFNSILVTLAYCGAIVLVCILMAMTGPPSMDDTVAHSSDAGVSSSKAL
jgi:hypothetical protein